MIGLDSSRVLLKQSATGQGDQPPACNPQSLRAQGCSEAQVLLQHPQMRLPLLSLSSPGLDHRLAVAL